MARSAKYVVALQEGINILPFGGSMKTQRTGVYAGSFDPITIGHLWMIEQGARLFDRLVVTVGINPDKKYTFSLEDRLAMLRESIASIPNVSVTTFSNRYLIHYAQSVNTSHILRGISSSAVCVTSTTTSTRRSAPCS
jgi:cytidyltransferase-like protein